MLDVSRDSHDDTFRRADPVIRLRPRSTAALLACILLTCGASSAQEGPGRRQDPDGASIRKELKDEVADFWIYEDLETARRRALETGRPMLVSLRCVP